MYNGRRNLSEAFEKTATRRFPCLSQIQSIPKEVKKMKKRDAVPHIGIMFNEDPNHHIGETWATRKTYNKGFRFSEESEREFVRQYEGSQLTDFLINVNFMRSVYPSEVFDSYTTSGLTFNESGLPVDENGNVLEETENAYYETFVRDNFDIFDCWIRNFREIGVRPWLSFRMNDVHGVAENETGMLTKFWQEHPETYRIHHHVPDGYFARTFDYEQQIVRDRMYAYIKEALERYDVDGVELDFMREMFCFAPGREFLCRDLMTDFVRSIRALCDEFEEKRGHRILIGIKLFALPHQVYDAGFDYFTYAEERLIDVFIAGPRWETIDNDIPIEIWKKIFEPYGVKVAAGLELILRCHPHGEFYYLNTVETTMASATQYLSAGGDFTYLFNYMRPVKVDYSKDWVYSIYQTENYQRLIRNAGSYETSFPLPRRHVKTFHDIEPQWESAKLSPLPLTVAYDNTFFQVKVRACPAPKDAKCYVVLGAKGVDSDEISPETFDIYMNGVHLEYGGMCEVTPYTKWQGYYFPIPDPALVADGNVIEIARKTGAPGYSVEYAEIRVNAALEKDQWEKDHLVWIEL